MDEIQELKAAQSTKLKDWYHDKYPNDPIYKEMNEKSTFISLFNSLDVHLDVYKTIFKKDLADSLVRERCFERLAEIMGISYEDVYDQWLISSKNMEVVK